MKAILLFFALGIAASDASSTSPTPLEDEDAMPKSPFHFFAVGDVPVGKHGEALTTPGGELRQYQLDVGIPNRLAEMSHSGGEFLVHLGDIQGSNFNATGYPGKCPEGLYREVYEVYESSPLPTFFVIDDHAWMECEDAEEAHGFWEEYLLRFEERRERLWSFASAPHRRSRPLDATVRRDADNPELFSFLLRDVLFVGQGLPGDSKDVVNGWRGRNEEGKMRTKDWYIGANVGWLNENVLRHEGRMRALVIFCHSAGSYGVANIEYSRSLRDLAVRYNETPILVLEERPDAEVEERWLDAANMVRMAVGNRASPKAVTVDVAKADGGDNVTGVFFIGIPDYDDPDVVDVDSGHGASGGARFEWAGRILLSAVLGLYFNRHGT